MSIRLGGPLCATASHAQRPLNRPCPTNALYTARLQRTTVPSCECIYCCDCVFLNSCERRRTPKHFSNAGNRGSKPPTGRHFFPREARKNSRSIRLGRGGAGVSRPATATGGGLTLAASPPQFYCLAFCDASMTRGLCGDSSHQICSLVRGHSGHHDATGLRLYRPGLGKPSRSVRRCGLFGRRRGLGRVQDEGHELLRPAEGRLQAQAIARVASPLLSGLDPFAGASQALPWRPCLCIPPSDRHRAKA